MGLSLAYSILVTDMKILVITPDGDIGRRVMAELLSPEFTVRVIPDDSAGLPEEWIEQVEVIAGPTDNAETLLRALAGVGSVLWCIPAGTNQEIEPFACALSRAMREVGTPRLVTISTAGCGLIRSAGIIPSQPAIEAILDKSGAMIRHLRCGLLTESRFSQGQSILEKGTFSLPVPGEILVPLVEADDGVDVALRWLVRQDWEGIERLVVSGPRPVLL
jgi:uncharacterized protein YbjT (DUF2867 family)